jgi:hypothetical protein
VAAPAKPAEAREVVQAKESVAVPPAQEGDKALAVAASAPPGAAVEQPVGEAIAAADVVVENGGVDNIVADKAVADTGKAAAAQEPAPAQGANSGEFSLGLGDFKLTNGTVNVLHQLSAATSNEIKLQDIAIAVQGFAFPDGDIQGFSLDSRINEAGKVALQGSGDIDPLKADFKLQLADFSLADLMPYIAPVLSIKLESGTVGAQLSGSVAQVGDVLNSQVSGNAQVEKLLVKDAAKNAKILSFNALNVNESAWNSEQPSLKIDQIEFDQAFAKVVIFKDGTTNLSRLVVPAPDTADTEASAAPPVEDAQAAPPLAIDIRTIDFRDGMADFSDLSLPRPFRAAIHGIKGDIKGLSSSASAAALVDITGAVDKYAPVTLKGKVKPLSEKLLVDLDLNFRNLELTSVSPYSDTYAGYNIDKGKLNADFKYFIDGSKLEAQNSLIIDQLTLGERTDSPDATSLPVALAIALLKDKNGVIDLNLPITGDIDDPEFRYGALVGKALLNLVTKIVTAPFALLGSLVGGGEDMDVVPFEAGKSDFSAAEASQLNKLADALTERPQLSLSVRGVAVPAVDGPALQEASLAAALQDEGVSVPVPANEWKSVFKLYSKSTGQKIGDLEDEIAATQPMEKEQLQEALQQRVWSSLLAAQDVDETQLQQLARDRSDSVRETLAAAGIDAGRLFILDPEIDTDAQAKPHGKLELDAK